MPASTAMDGESGGTQRIVGAPAPSWPRTRNAGLKRACNPTKATPLLTYYVSLNRPIIIGVVLLGGLFIVSINLMVDLLYAALDPRVR